MSAPSPVAGFRRAVRLGRAVAAVWLLSMAALVPAQVVMLAKTGSVRANLPAGGLDHGEGLVVFFEILRPVAVPLATALCCGGVLFIAWCVLWHAGTVRWWIDDGRGEVRVTPILGAGLPVWWRYARLALVVLALQVVALVAPWLPLRFRLEERALLPVLIVGVVLAGFGSVLVWLGGLRGAWLLGESGRQSALVAWCRGLWAAVRQPLRSVLTLVVWAAPGLALLVLPVAFDGPGASVVLPGAWLACAFCWMALHMSFAPPQSTPEPPTTPHEKPPAAPYVTTRFPTLHSDR